MIFTPRLSNSGLILAMYPSSVVQIGVKSLGCENSTAQESPIQSWKLILPSVVFATKSGAVSPMARLMLALLGAKKSSRPGAQSTHAGRNPDQSRRDLCDRRNA